jgi:hypothetical protein
VAAKSRAEKEERRTLREKKALQKANQQAGIEADDEFEPRASPIVRLPFFPLSSTLITILFL